MPLAAAADTAACPAGVLRRPVPGFVIAAAAIPADPYAAGRRAARLATGAGRPVRAPVAGRIVFAGAVAATTYVTIAVAAGSEIRLGPLAPTVAVGADVAAHTVIGTAVASDVGISLVAGETYLDPVRCFAPVQTRAVDLPA